MSSDDLRPARSIRASLPAEPSETPASPADDGAAVALPRGAARSSLAAVAAMLAACGGGGGGGGSTAGGAAPPSGAAPTHPDAAAAVGGSTTVGSPQDPSNVPSQDPSPQPPDGVVTKVPEFPPTAQQAARFLQQAQFSSTAAEIEALHSKGYAAWLDEQFAVTDGPTAWGWLDAMGYNVVADDTRYYDNHWPGNRALWHQLMVAGGQLRKRLALALSEFFVVSGVSVECAWRSHAMAGWWDLLVARVDGNFRTLLEDVALNPAMGLYLNTLGNQKENSQTGRMPDENFAREVMQLFTIGLYELQPDGTPRLVGGRPVETYTIDDITHLARVFTGYGFDGSGSVDFNFARGSTSTDGNVANPLRLRNRMICDAGQHSPLEVRFLGTTIPAGTTGPAALKAALDALFAHPNVGPFFGRQMIQRLVTSNPSAAYVARVARTFDDNGAGVRGDLKAVFKAILLDPEARADGAAGDPAFGKLREPMVRLVQWARTFGLASASGSWAFDNYADPERLGQQPLWSPTVFNYFRPAYVPPKTRTAAAGRGAPELQTVSEVSVAGYLNFLQGAVQAGLNGDVKALYAHELARVADAADLVDHLNLVLAAGQLPAAVLRQIADALSTMPTATAAARYDRVAAAVLMVMATPAYLIQR